MSTAVKSHFNITSKGVLGGLINGGGLYPGGLISGIKKNVWERRDKTYLRDELKLKYHYILSWSVTFTIHLLYVTKQLVYL